MGQGHLTYSGNIQSKRKRTQKDKSMTEYTEMPENPDDFNDLQDNHCQMF